MSANMLDLWGHLYKLQFLMDCGAFIWELSFPAVYILSSFERLQNCSLKLKCKNGDINKHLENESYYRDSKSELSFKRASII